MSWNVITVSKYDNITNYDAVGNAIDGVLIKVGYRAYGSTATLVTDTKFNSHYNGFLGKCKIGFYFLSAAITGEEAIAEANYVYNLIKDKHCDFPIYLNSDFSTVDHTGRADYLSKEHRTSYLISFCNRIKELGYRAGVYATDNWFATELNITSIYDNQYSILDSRYSSEKPVQVTGYDGWEYTNEAIYTGSSAGLHASYFYNDVANWSNIGPGIQIDINNLTIKLSDYEFTYTGKQIDPTVTIGELKQGIDFTVSYSDNVNIGTGTVIITGIGNYTGVATENFTIVPKDINDYELIISPSSYTYTGERITPNIILGNLVVGYDYIIECNNNLEIGTALVKVYGVNNYTGSMSGNFKIVNKSIEDLNISYKDTWTFTGYEIKPEVFIDGLYEGTDYEVTYSNNITVGNGIINIEGINNYSGIATKYFTIIEEAIVDSRVIFNPPSFIYSGEECIPDISVEGVPEEDYDVEITDNINAGIARVTIIGKNNYSGTIYSSFIIEKKSISIYKINKIEDKMFTNNLITPDIIIDGLEKGKDYTIQYINNKKIGIATATANGIGNYKDSTSITFNIIYRPIGECILKVGTASRYTPYRVDGPMSMLVEEDGYIMQPEVDYHVVDYKREQKETFILVTYVIAGLGNFTDAYTFITKVVDNEPPVPEGYDDGLYNFGDIDINDETAVGEYNFLNIDPNAEDDVETDIIDGTDFDYEAMSGIYIDDYDNDDGKHTGPDGEDIDPDNPIDPYPDDGKFNFGDIELDDETAEGDWDFGDLDEGIDEDTVVGDGKNYDFDRFSESDFVPGDEYELEDTPIYANYCSTKSSGTRSGLYFVYKGNVINNRIRLTKLESAIDSPVRTSGWFDINDLAMLGRLKVNQPILVTGRIVKYTNGTGPYFDVRNQLMYVVEVSDPDLYDYAYAVAYNPRNARVGWVAEDMVTRIKRPEEYVIKY